MGCWRERHFKNKPRHCNYLKKWGNCSSFRHKFPICIIDKEGTEHFYHLGWTFRSGVLSLIQFVPALHQFNDDRPAEVHQLETSHIGTAMHEPLQRYVLKALRKKRETEERDDSKHPKLVTARGGSGRQNHSIECANLCWNIILHLLRQFTRLFIALINVECNSRQPREWLHAEWHSAVKWSWRGIHLGAGHRQS